MKVEDTGIGDTSGGADGQSVCCSPGGADTVALAHCGAHQIAPVPQASCSGRNSKPSTQKLGIQPHRFVLTVPFPTPLEAEIAYGSLAADTEPHQTLVGKELKVNGSILAVHWTSEDSRLLRISIINFLDQLSLVVNTIQRFGPPVSR
ncbi:EKC/KEOPS complex subunit LAGE3 [Nannospalax galili]|uniref:L antigen family member 3 n=1 Tax=Nannospalax galili TaxID=1026970 RepID=A0A8C6S3K0_NANGA|nr:EKC/KEOPS complex subunit LAGE3 [Nannospalax galili]